MVAEEKTCSSCHVSKPATGEHFPARKGKWVGLRAQCRVCYLDANRRCIARNPAKHAAAAHLCYVRKKAEYRAVNKVWIANNIERVRARQRNQNRKTLATSKGLLRNRVGPYIRMILYRRAKGSVLHPGVMRWLPYSMEELAAHLEGLFLPGMGWHNVRAWEVDHVRPVASFEFESPSDPGFQECWAMTNLQPLWAEDNRRKGAKVAA